MRGKERRVEKDKALRFRLDREMRRDAQRAEDIASQANTSGQCRDILTAHPLPLSTVVEYPGPIAQCSYQLTTRNNQSRGELKEAHTLTGKTGKAIEKGGTESN